MSTTQRTRGAEAPTSAILYCNVPSTYGVFRAYSPSLCRIERTDKLQGLPALVVHCTPYCNVRIVNRESFAEPSGPVSHKAHQPAVLM